MTGTSVSYADTLARPSSSSTERECYDLTHAFNRRSTAEEVVVQNLKTQILSAVKRLLKKNHSSSPETTYEVFGRRHIGIDRINNWMKISLQGLPEKALMTILKLHMLFMVATRSIHTLQITTDLQAVDMVKRWLRSKNVRIQYVQNVFDIEYSPMFTVDDFLDFDDKPLVQPAKQPPVNLGSVADFPSILSSSSGNSGVKTSRASRVPQTQTSCASPAPQTQARTLLDHSSMQMFQARNTGAQVNVVKLDMHELRTARAMMILRLHMLFAYTFKAISHLDVITGYGADDHPRGKIKKQVQNWVDKYRIPHHAVMKRGRNNELENKGEVMISVPFDLDSVACLADGDKSD